jgi:hypothetical protein
MKVPEIAGGMREIAQEIEGDYPDQSGELFELADELRRRSPGPRARVTSTPMRSELAQEIRGYADANPGMSHQAIAEQFNVNHGRVSEAINGKRD